MRSGGTLSVEDRLAASGWLGLWLGFAWCIGLHTWGLWYSPSLAHRLQTEALLRGSLALQVTPHGQMADWAWANGSQHVWGLGVALLRLPFEAAAKLAGASGFPDRIVLLFAFMGTSLLYARVFATVGRWGRFALVLVVLATPAFVTLCRTRFTVYEESVAYAHLWALAMAGTLLCLAQQRRNADLFVVCTLAGLAPLLRPTLIFDASVTVALALGLQVRARRPTPAVLAAAVFGAGLALVAAINRLRFGSIFETGQLLNVSYIPTDQFAKLFGYPFWNEPFRRAAAELISSLVLRARWNAPWWYAPAIHPWQSATLRFREFYCTTFTPLQLVLLVASWFGIAMACAAARSRPRLHPLVRAPVGMAAIWSSAVFACQFLFYLWAPSMTSRYAVDFAAPLAIGLSALLLLLLRSAELFAPAGQSRRWRFVVTALAVLWVLHDIVAAEVAPSHRAGPLLNAGQVATALQRSSPAPGSLPHVYRCGDSPEVFGIKFNGSGWATPGSCEVHALTMLFFERPECLRVQIEPAANAAPLRSEDTAMVRAKLGLSEMQRMADAPAGDGRRLTFCTPVDHQPNPHGIELLYLGWTTPAELSPQVRPFRLLEVAQVSPP